MATPSQVAALSWSLIGAVVLLAFIALVVSLLLERKRSLLLLLALLATASTLVTAENMRLHSSTSVAKHDDFGVWFACIAAGYALARAAELIKRPPVRIPVIIVAFSVAAWIGAHYADNSAPINTNSSQSASRLAADLRAYTILKPYLASSGRDLLGGLQATQMPYDDHVNLAWYQYFDDDYIKYPIPGRGGDSHGQTPGLACGGSRLPQLGPACVYVEGIPGYEAAIRAHWFSLVSLIGNRGTSQDAVIRATVEATPGYRLLTTASGNPTYIYAPDYPRRLGGTAP